MDSIKEQCKGYDTDITDEQWKEIEPLYAGMRKRRWSKRELTNAVLYINKTGCQRRNLPHDFPPYKTVSSFYQRAKQCGLWDKILKHLVKKVHVNNGKPPTPGYGLVDSQSAKTAAASEKRGIDGEKNERPKKTYRSKYHGQFIVRCGSCCQHTRYKVRNFIRPKGDGKISSPAGILCGCGVSRHFCERCPE